MKLALFLMEKLECLTNAITTAGIRDYEEKNADVFELSNKIRRQQRKGEALWLHGRRMEMRD